MNARKAAGWVSLIFLLIFTGLTYLSYRTIWADKKKH
jgi:ubiquinol-cytochrome c reductase cytochrome c1 subunit